MLYNEWISKVALILRMIKFSHTIFALPFAIISFIINLDNSFVSNSSVSNSFVSNSFVSNSSPFLPPLYKIILIILALVFARSFSMAFNRLVDLKYDKNNPRTNKRELVLGKISKRGVIVYIIINCLAFLVCTYFINDLSFYASFPLIILLLGYSYMKRYTALVHFYLGFVIGLVPIAVEIALYSTVSLSSILLFISLGSWIAGFDILYSLLDLEFDKKAGLYSLPAIFGKGKALLISRIAYIVMILSLFGFGFVNADKLFYTYYYGVFFILLLLIFQQWQVKVKGNMVFSKRFFMFNALISIIYLTIFIISY